jgi:hypothetical protein
MNGGGEGKKDCVNTGISFDLNLELNRQNDTTDPSKGMLTGNERISPQNQFAKLVLSSRGD